MLFSVVSHTSLGSQRILGDIHFGGPNGLKFSPLSNNHDFLVHRSIGRQGSNLYSCCKESRLVKQADRSESDKKDYVKEPVVENKTEKQKKSDAGNKEFYKNMFSGENKRTVRSKEDSSIRNEPAHAR